MQRGFCANCGSTLFWKPIIDGYAYTAVAMGLFDTPTFDTPTFDTPTDARFSKHIFVNDKGDYYAIDDSVEQSESH